MIFNINRTNFARSRELPCKGANFKEVNELRKYIYEIEINSLEDLKLFKTR